MTPTSNYYVAGYWFRTNPTTINGCEGCAGASLTPIKDPTSGEYLDIAEVVARYLQAKGSANPSTGRVSLICPLPAPLYGFNEIQPIQGVPTRTTFVDHANPLYTTYCPPVQ